MSHVIAVLMKRVVIRVSFLETLNSAIWDAENGYAEPGDIVDLNMIICNSLYEPLQRLKMAIVHVEY